LNGDVFSKLNAVWLAVPARNPSCTKRTLVRHPGVPTLKQEWFRLTESWRFVTCTGVVQKPCVLAADSRGSGVTDTCCQLYPGAEFKKSKLLYSLRLKTLQQSFETCDSTIIKDRTFKNNLFSWLNRIFFYKTFNFFNQHCESVIATR
jgi:hypothetical protein